MASGMRRVAHGVWREDAPPVWIHAFKQRSSIRRRFRAKNEIDDTASPRADGTAAPPMDAADADADTAAAAAAGATGPAPPAPPAPPPPPVVLDRYGFARSNAAAHRALPERPRTNRQSAPR